MDVYFGIEIEKDYCFIKGIGWLEILGCGMVDFVVLENCGIDFIKYIGFVFGMGIEWQVLCFYDIGDICFFFENDVCFLK